MTQTIIHDLQVHRAQRIFDQFLADDLTHQDAIATLMQAFGLEQEQANLLLNEAEQEHAENR